MINVICYKTKEPIYYNKGTKWETTHDTFLLCYGSNDDEENAKWVAELNELMPLGQRWKRIPIPENVAYFFASKQEPFDTMGD